MNAKIKPNRVEIDTRLYAMAYGRSPKGRGGWAFHPDADVAATDPSIIWTPSMTYDEARRVARKIAARRGWDYLVALT